MAAKKKKHSFKWLLIITSGIVLFGIIMIGGAGSSFVVSNAGREETEEKEAVSKLESYIQTQSIQQSDLTNAAEEEIKRRNTEGIRGGDDYIRNLSSDKSSEQSSNQSSALSKTEKGNTGIGLINAQWDSYFIGYIMQKAGADMSVWNSYPSVFATKIHKQRQFSLPEDYIPKVGDIIFFGQQIKSLSVGTAINAMYCGIVSEIDTITEGTTITAMRITVIEPDTAGDINQGNYDHRTSQVKKYSYDLYDSKGNNHHGSDTYEKIIGYGTVITDRNKEISAEPSDYTHAQHYYIKENDKDILVYTIDLRSTYEDAKKENETP